MIKFIKTNKETLKKIFTLTLLTIFIIFAVTEFRHINFRQYHDLFENLSITNRILVIALGIAAFFFCTIYDFIMAHHFKINIPKKSILKIAFITQSFNNFISFGGLTGTKLRSDLYTKKGVDQKTALKIGTSILTSGMLGLCTLIIPSLILMQTTSRKYLYLLGLMALYIPFYFFAGKLKIKKLQKFIDENSPFSFLDTKTKLQLLIASVIDWLTVSLYFSFTVKLISPEIPVIRIILIYLISEVIGIISFIPGGLGSFDMSVILIFGDLGYNTNNILLSLLLFRISFYVIPWIIGVILFIHDQLTLKKERIAQSQEIVVTILSTLIFLSGILLIISTATPAMINRIKWVKDWLPHTIVYLTKGLTFLIGVILIIMSRGIKLRLKRIYKISLILLILGIIGCIMKGFDYEEALVLTVFASLLYYTRNLYTKEHINMKSSDIYKLAGVYTIATASFVIIYNLSHKINIYTSHRPFSLHWVAENPFKIIGFIVFSAIIFTLLLYSKKDYLEFKEVTEKDIDKFCNFIKDYQGNYYTHFYFMRDKNVFYNSKRTVAMLYRPLKDNIIVLGDPVGKRSDFEEAIDELIHFASEYDMKVSFYEVLGSNLELYADQGFSFIKIGEDATVHLKDFTYDGKRNKNLRKMHNRLEENFKFEIYYPPHSQELMKELKEISDSWLQGKPELAFSLGGFDEYYLNCAPIAVLKDKNDKISVFANIQPVVNTKQLTIDLMRYKKDQCDNNEMDLLFLALIDWAKEKEYSEFYMGMAPLSNVGGKKYSGTKEKIMKLIYQYGNKFYSFQGLRYFKEKFHPEWSGRYIIYKNDMELPDVLLSIVTLVHRNK